jgi:threonine/homoserine/homoserine lactone efflux protein
MMGFDHMMNGFPWFEFLALMLAFGINAVVPGPDFAMVLRQSIVHGRKTAILTSLGVASAILVHGSYTLLGIGLIVSQSLLLFSILKIAGALYLLWLGITTFLLGVVFDHCECRHISCP